MSKKAGNNRLRRFFDNNWVSYFLVIFLILLVLLSLAYIRLYNVNFNSEMSLIETEASLTLQYDANVVNDEISQVLEDLRYFSEHNELQSFLNNDPGASEKLAKEYLAFANTHYIYDQIRLLDINGMELVRVNFNDGAPSIVPDDELQDKGSRYYFQETLKLSEGQIYVSAFDLNMEQDVIEQPLKPVLRIGAPVFDSDGNKRGIVMLNYLGNQLFEKMRLVPRDILHILFLNKDGYYMIGLQTENEWGFMFEDRQDITFANTYPKANAVISQNESGTFRNDEGLFSYTKVNPVATHILVEQTTGAEEYTEHSSEYYWTLINYIHADDISAMSRDMLSRFGLIFGIVAVLLGIGAAITARAMYRRRQADRALRESEERYRNLADLLPQIVFEITSDGHLTFLNKTGLRLLRYDQEDISQGLTAAEMILPEDSEKLQEYLKDLNTGEQLEPAEYTAQRKDGSTFPVMVYLEPSVPGDELKRFRGIAVDITEIKRIDRMKTEFISIASHELKSPLSSIYGFTKLLQDEDTGKTNETQKEFLGIIETQANLLTSLVNDLLDVARIESGRFKLELNDININDVVKEVVTTLAPQAKEKSIKISTDLKYKEGQLTADRNRLVQIMFNLLSNAIKYNRDKGWVKVTVQKTDGMIQVDVADNGLGIPEADIPSLFTRFFRAANVGKSKSSGTGLGLHIAKSIIEMHGGTIKVESTEEKGSTFTFTLPVQQEKAKPDEDEKAKLK